MGRLNKQRVFCFFFTVREPASHGRVGGEDAFGLARLDPRL